MNALKEVKYAPQVNNIAHALKDRSNLTDPGDIALMEELFRLLSIVEPADEDGRRSLWITAERGPIEAAGSFEDYRDLEEVDTYDEYVERWKWYYPDERYWYNVIAVRRDDYMAVLLNRQIVLEVDPDHTAVLKGGFMMVDPRLYSLIKVVETGNYTKAAEQLALSQPAVSQIGRAHV